MLNECSPTIVNTIFERNTGIGAIFFSINVNSTITHCDFWSNRFEDFAGNISPGLGIIDTVNANNDPCDCFCNIFLDPLFVDPFGENYYLQSGSPCIDAGDPASPLDPDGTVADIGAFYFDQLGVEDQTEAVQPSTFRLFPNYPNPFNASTVLRYNLPHSGSITLTIHNALGQVVATLFQGRQPSGVHTVTWDASDVGSGIYFARLRTEDRYESVKMVLIR
jgi:hypothetical protein